MRFNAIIKLILLLVTLSSCASYDKFYNQVVRERKAEINELENGYIDNDTPWQCEINKVEIAYPGFKNENCKGKKQNECLSLFVDQSFARLEQAYPRGNSSAMYQHCRANVTECRDMCYAEKFLRNSHNAAIDKDVSRLQSEIETEANNRYTVYRQNIANALRPSPKSRVNCTSSKVGSTEYIDCEER